MPILEDDPDFSECNLEMKELMRLSRFAGFDLFSLLRLFSEAGAPTFCAQIDDGTAPSTGRRVIHYKLSEGLRVILSALRARNIDPYKIESSAGGGSAIA
jgi:hypothetical protein